MTSASASAKTSRTIKSLVTVLIVFLLFLFGSLKTSYASAATLNFSSADLSPGFCQDDALMLSFYTLSFAASALLKFLISRKIFFHLNFFL
jgi:hypothetical protein